MANCAKCRHAKEIERLRKICLGCSIGKVNKDGSSNCGLSKAGHSVISLDAAKDENCRDRIARHGVQRDVPAVVESPLNPAEREHLLRVIYMFSSLSYDEAGMVCRMMQGCSLQQIADERGQSLQTVHARWKSLTKRNPAWLSLANGMIGSGRGRKPDVRETSQMDFFDIMGGGNGQAKA